MKHTPLKRPIIYTQDVAHDEELEELPSKGRMYYP